MRTTFVWMLLAGLACAAPAPAPKVDPESWVGRTVLIEPDPVRVYPDFPNAPDAPKGGSLSHIDYRVLASRSGAISFRSTSTARASGSPKRTFFASPTRNAGSGTGPPKIPRTRDTTPTARGPRN